MPRSMPVARRAALGLLALPALLPARGLAQPRWPDRPIRFLQGFGAGGTTDIVARLIAPSLAAHLGQPVVMENRPGAGGTLAAEGLARARDGHTMMLINNGYAVSAALYRRLPYDPLADVEPVAMVASVGLVLLAGGGAEAPRDMAELVRRAKASPGALNLATVGVGSTQHFVAEAIQAAAGIRLTHVPYRGTPAALVALRNGEVELVVEPASSVLGQIRGGEARPLAITSRDRSPLLPDVPTVAELLGAPDFDIQTWYAIALPAGTPPDVVARVTEAAERTLADPALRARLGELGLAPRATIPPDAVKAAVHAEITRWAGVIQRTGMERQ
ncbi:tripartite tricarboxylate transporter substrate binding protein [Roseomonas sp. SSH11]|uniref:Tripartite tricarboxylate transporter substrate binding protein n=1 Tax=Pararoseomonas baculiformis TaxID=2820812 RepID=A0ABS4AEW6_9PROT|nr:tripartite tricarboxylate transporter substrate-binding protein [Pararoseomonas baculiformis]MBP0445531.1 tripartite tricarboxylate transporter substrate binding protein [Pararoseomonas baculiformis]